MRLMRLLQMWVDSASGVDVTRQVLRRRFAKHTRVFGLGTFSALNLKRNPTFTG